MPRPINMDQNDDGQVILEDPYLGADPDEEVDENETVDFGDSLDADTPKDDEEEAPAEEEEETPADDEEEETPADDEEEEEEEEEETPPADEPKDDQRIPKKRFDEVNERRKLAEKKLADRESADAAALAAENNTFDFDAKEREYMELTVDGEFDKALEIRAEIRAAENSNYERMTTTQAQETREQAKVDVSFQDTLSELEVQYPQFSNKEAEGYNQDLVDEVLDLHDGFMNKGYDPSIAIQKAVNYVAKANDIIAVGDEAPAPKVPTDKPTNKADLKAKAKAKTTQPQQLPKGDGAPEPALDLPSMSEDEFDALPESKRRELRGDFI